MEKSRFSEAGETIFEFVDNVLVECPRCNNCAKMTWAPFKSIPKLVCEKCGLVAVSPIASYGGPEFCGVSLWLKTSCCSNTLWAYNNEHLDFLENYVSASIREQLPNINRSLASRLPSWIKSAKNRESILKCIKKLRKQLN
ncbi:hypothetical protein ACFCYN_07875 [Gottfriedia sp. NPDC056225]|uniref:hypothetical protein n=1 Tax=Gottfriedia sp. NPDC056225 TaxID=3345751 RepID=UPI0035DF27A1